MSKRRMYSLRQDLGRQSWQNITHNTLLSLFYENNSDATSISKWLRGQVPIHYEEFRRLKRIEIEEPNSEPIRMFVRPEDMNSFENIQDRIRRNSPTIDEIRHKREKLLESEISKTRVKLHSGRTLESEFARGFYNHSARPTGYSTSEFDFELVGQDIRIPECRIFQPIHKITGEVGPKYQVLPRNIFDSDPNGTKRYYGELEYIVAACQWRKF